MLQNQLLLKRKLLQGKLNEWRKSEYIEIIFSENTTVTTTSTTVVFETTTTNDTVIPPIVMVDDDESSEKEDETIETTEAATETTTEATEEPQGFLARTKVSTHPLNRNILWFLKIYSGQNRCCCSICLFHLITPVKYFCSQRIKEAKIIE